VAGKVARRGRWVLASVAGAGLVISSVVRLRARRRLGQEEAPADVSFMRALHAALRRDLSRLQDAAAVLAEIPPPARLVYRRVLRPRYQAQHHWQIPNPATEP